jgi:hypothetical protein
MMPDLITDVKKYKKGWSGGLPETPCGYGSKVNQTIIQRAWIPHIVEKYGIQSIADIGAGDLNWIGQVKWPHPIQYTPFDLVPRAEGVEAFDIIHEVPPASDLLMVLWLLNHLPEDHAQAAMNNLLNSGSKYLMLTYEPRQWDCTDLRAVDSVVIRDRGKGDPRGNVELRLVKC